MHLSLLVQNYEEAIHHLLTSLSVQEADSEHERKSCQGCSHRYLTDVKGALVDLLDPTPSNAPQNGITSQTLWDSLNVSLIQ